MKIFKQYTIFIHWWERADTGDYLPRWILLGVYTLLMWWQIGMLNELGLGGYLINTVAIVCFIILVVLPRRYWFIPIMLVYIMIYWLVLPRSFGIVHKDHIAYLEGPLKALSEGRYMYEIGVSENPYMPWSALIFWPFWKFGIHDMRFVMSVATTIAGLFLYLAQKNRSTGILLLMLFLINGFTLESNLYMYLANANMVMFGFAGLYLLNKNNNSILGILLVALAAVIKQQFLLLGPFLIIWLVWRKKYKLILIYCLSVFILLVPFILPNLNDFIFLTFKTHSDTIPYFYYSQLNNFWKFSPFSLQNILSLFPGGTTFAWANRLLPINFIIYSIVLIWFAKSNRSWSDVVKYYVLAGILLFSLSIAVNIATYYLYFLVMMAFTDDKQTQVKC